MDQFALLTEAGLPSPVELSGPDRETTGQVLQRVLVDRATELRPLYWRTCRNERDGAGAYDATLCPDGTIALLPGTTLCFDTYFGAFFEPHWRMNTTLSRLALSVSVLGPCVVRLRRRSIGVDRLLGELRCDSGLRPETLRFEVPDGSSNFREYGLLYFEVTATGPGASFLAATWLGEAPAAPVALGVVFCTFNREPFIAAVLQVMADDPVLLGRLDRVFVVNQGTPGLADHPQVAPLLDRFEGRLSIIEQDNFGGAGGFTRGMLATLDDGTLTHCAFLDDDIRLEPDTILRMIAFLSLARENVAVGGHMLDGVQPTRLYEGGAVIDPFNWFPQPVQRDVDLASADGLGRLAQPQSVHFNGWWCFALPLDIVRRLGLPMPCFIRGDDAEYGMRLYRAGVFTTALPGAAVWHEPFYLKLGSWQLYYETRNLLVLAALHERFSPAAALRRVGRTWVMHMLTFRYYSAMLIMRGAADFLHGPDILRQDPQRLHASVMTLRAKYGPTLIDRKQVLTHARVARMPRHRATFMFWFAFVLLRNALVPTARARPLLVGQGDLSWPGLRHADHIVLDNWWEPEMSAYHRDRRVFWEIARRMLPVLARLATRGTAVSRTWQQAAPELTSEPFWRRYLSGSAAAPTDASTP